MPWSKSGLSVEIRHLLSRLLLVILVLSLVGPTVSDAQAPAPRSGEERSLEEWLEEQLAQMTTADKIGQLFLVSFDGTSVDPASDIARLVQVYRVGGVVLSPENGNFGNDPSTPEQVQALTMSLQQLAFSDSPPVTITRTTPITDPVPGATTVVTTTPPLTLSTVVTVTETITQPAQNIPLFLAVAQEGDGYPFTQVRGGLTICPATWPSVQPGTRRTRKLSVRLWDNSSGPWGSTFSWVLPWMCSALPVRGFPAIWGRACLVGIHIGSARWAEPTFAAYTWVVRDGWPRLPSTFLGLGGSDRSLEEEVATIDKSLQDLRLIELPPFFAVTQSEAVTDTTDALMTAHIRYRGFQGNIRYVTPPISLHSQGMQQIMAQAELVPWREGGGLLVSDVLGVPAIRRYYSPSLETFPHRQIALDAFQAGNDLLNLSRFSLDESWEGQVRNIEDTISFFQSRYEADDGFRVRVDQSVRRILGLKRRLCADFTLAACTPDQEDQAALTGAGCCPSGHGPDCAGSGDAAISLPGGTGDQCATAPATG